jgi:hypothetical protein
MSVPVDVVYPKQGKFSRLYVDKNVTVEQLKSKIVNVLNEASSGDVALGYFGRERNYVGITTDDELKIALDLYTGRQSLKVFVRSSTDDPSSASSSASAGAGFQFPGLFFHFFVFIFCDVFKAVLVFSMDLGREDLENLGRMTIRMAIVVIVMDIAIIIIIIIMVGNQELEEK